MKLFNISIEYHNESPIQERINKSFTVADVDHRPYMKDTFNSKIKKEISHKRIDSIDQNRIPKSLRKSPKYKVTFFLFILTSYKEILMYFVLKSNRQHLMMLILNGLMICSDNSVTKRKLIGIKNSI